MAQAKKDYVERSMRIPRDLHDEMVSYAGKQPFGPNLTTVMVALLRKGLAEATRRKAAG